MVMEKAGIKRAKVEEALESESYDYVAITYFLQAEKHERETSTLRR